MTPEPKTICVDFDDTLFDTTYPKVNGPKPGAREAMQRFRDMGFFIIVSSCRACGWNWDCYYKDQPYVHASERPAFRAIQEALDQYDIPYDLIDDGTKGKVSASYYLDDKGVRYENNWPEIVRFVEEKEGKLSNEQTV